MTGEWLTVRSIVKAEYALCVVMMLVAFVQLQGNARRLLVRISSFVWMIPLLVYMAQRTFGDPLATRVSYLGAGFVELCVIAALMRLLTRAASGLAES